jgi:hypothetical protein
MREGVRLIGLGYRMKKYIDSETSAGRLPMMNPFYKSPAGISKPLFLSKPLFQNSFSIFSL